VRTSTSEVTSVQVSPPSRVRQAARLRRRRLAGGHHELDAEAAQHAFEAVHLGGVVEVEQAAGFGVGDAQAAGDVNSLKASKLA